MARLIKFCFLITFIFVLAGCATSRGYLDIQVPVVNLISPNGKQVYIRSVTDNRQFLDNTWSADIRSPDFGGFTGFAPEVKNRVIVGKGWGDIMLDENQNVQGIIYEATKNSLYSLGYAVVDKQEEARPDAIIMDISIDRFWGYATDFKYVLTPLPRYVFIVTLKSEIITTDTIIVPKRGNPIIIKATATKRCSRIMDKANWKKVFRLVINDFIDKAKKEFKNFDVNR